MVVHPTASVPGSSVESRLDRTFVIDDRNFPWHDVVMARFGHICLLRSGWDGYAARPVDFATANFALRILYAVCSPSTPAPSIVPGVDGDLQIEWHTPAWDIEVRVLAPNLVEAWREPADRQGADEESFTSTTDFTMLHSWLKQLAEPAFADFASTTR